MSAYMPLLSVSIVTRQVTTMVTLLSVLLVSAERLMTIKHGKYHPTTQKPKCMKIKVLLMWIVSLSLSFPLQNISNITLWQPCDVYYMIEILTKEITITIVMDTVTALMYLSLGSFTHMSLNARSSFVQRQRSKLAVHLVIATSVAYTGNDLLTNGQPDVFVSYRKMGTSIKAKL